MEKDTKKNSKLIKILLTLLLSVSAAIVPIRAIPSMSDKGDTLEVHFIDVGQGDATLIKLGGHAMLIDAGDNSCGTLVQNYLQKQGVDSLDYFVITHTDSDHAGGADVVISKFNCKEIIYPDVTSTTTTWHEVLSAMKYKHITRTNPVVGDSYPLGDASYTILNPQTLKDMSDNDTSVALRLTYGATSFLFVGDTETAAQEAMLNSHQPLASTVYKVSHHGSRHGTISEFLEAVHPTYAVISCGEGNSYGHPHAAILNLLRQAKVQVFRTDEQGSVMVTSDGSTLTWNCSPSDTWQAGEPTGSSQNQGSRNQASLKHNTSDRKHSDTETTYVLNTRTMKFHLPSCEAAAEMSPNNKKPSSDSRQELIKQGYSPCGSCRP